MSTETGQTVEEKKGREAAEEASALDKLTDRVCTLHYASWRKEKYTGHAWIGKPSKEAIFERSCHRIDHLIYLRMA
jgi:hypothetical protein